MTGVFMNTSYGIYASSWCYVHTHLPKVCRGSHTWVSDYCSPVSVWCLSRVEWMRQNRCFRRIEYEQDSEALIAPLVTVDFVLSCTLSRCDTPERTRLDGPPDMA